MLTEFKAYIKSTALFQLSDTILLAVSGGIDSVAMVDLFQRSGYNYAVAHSNFGLRNKESDEDEAFVRELAERNGVSFFVKHFETKRYAEEQKISIQMAARELRYSWFDELLAEQGFAFVATAHHLDDQAETFFINLLRGTGISGLHGILPKQGKVIRPLMFATREQIMEFALNEKLVWKEDSSNKSRKYLRNKLRMDVLPELAKIDRQFSRKLDETISHLRDMETIFNHHVAGVAEDMVQHTNQGDLISIDWVYEYEPHDTWLFELLKPYGFGFPVVKEIVRSLDGFSGKIFYSPSHRLLRDRENLIIQPRLIIKSDSEDTDKQYIAQGTTRFSGALELIFTETEDIKNLKFGDAEIAYLDFDKLSFPLVLRKWEKGDWFIPFGNKGRKKLSDFFVDHKLSLADKENIWLLTSGKDIAWIIGLRIDNRFRITSQTHKVLLVTHVVDKKPESNPGGHCFLFS